jgi:hypothetical protein
LNLVTLSGCTGKERFPPIGGKARRGNGMDASFGMPLNDWLVFGFLFH